MVFRLLDILLLGPEMCCSLEMVREDEHLNGVDGLAMPSKWLAASLSVILISAILFYPVFSSLPGRSLALWTWLACNSYNSFLHGRLVPLVFLWMLWMVWQRRENDTCKPSIMGVGLLLLGLLFFLVAMRLTQPRVALLGLPFVVLGLELIFIKVMNQNLSIIFGLVPFLGGLVLPPYPRKEDSSAHCGRHFCRQP
ncbi:hypothetical protein OAL23_00570 [bacterium]|nr:hypothetical protein [bacterium]MDC0302640.1 hypothetical protein [bacterium]